MKITLQNQNEWLVKRPVFSIIRQESLLIHSLTDNSYYWIRDIYLLFLLRKFQINGF